MVAVLFASSGIEPSHLKVSVAAGTDPDLSPCRRNDQRADARERFGIADHVTARIKIHKALPARKSSVTRFVGEHVSEA